MTQSRKMKREGGKRSRIAGPSLPESFSSAPPSLPPVAPEMALALPSTPASAEVPADKIDRRFKSGKVRKQDRPAWYLPPDSKVRYVSLQIIAMRIAGMEDEEIAKSLGISPKSIGPYVYRAGKNGWLNIDNPKERIEYSVMHKAVSNLEAMLVDDTLATNKTVKHETTMKLLEGTVFKQFGEPAVANTQQTMVAIKIEMPTGPAQLIREDTTGGRPAYVDAE